MNEFKCTGEVTIPQTNTDVKSQTFPYWAQFTYDETVLLVLLSMEDGKLFAIEAGSGEPKIVPPDIIRAIPPDQCRGWSMVLGPNNADVVENGEPVDLTKVKKPKPEKMVDVLKNASFPGLFCHPSTKFNEGRTTVLFEYVPVQGQAEPGTALWGPRMKADASGLQEPNAETGTMRTDIYSRSPVDWEQIEGEVVIENKPGVEFPRIYSHMESYYIVHLANNKWAIVRKQTGRVGFAENTDRYILKTAPVSRPLPDGAKLTLKFTKA